MYYSSLPLFISPSPPLPSLLTPTFPRLTYNNPCVLASHTLFVLFCFVLWERATTLTIYIYIIYINIIANKVTEFSYLLNFAASQSLCLLAPIAPFPLFTCSISLPVCSTVVLNHLTTSLCFLFCLISFHLFATYLNMCMLVCAVSWAQF